MARPVDIRLRYLPLRSLVGTSIANPALWYELGDQLEAECRLLKFDNLTNRDVFIGVNGVSAWTVIPAGGFLLIDVSTNRSPISGLYAQAGTQFWANAAVAPTSGSVYLTTLSTSDS